MLARHGHRLDAVLELEVDEDAVVERLLKRAEIEGRADDTEDVIRERQAIYYRETAPLAKHYAEAGLLVQRRRHGRARQGHRPARRGPSGPPGR